MDTYRVSQLAKGSVMQEFAVVNMHLKEFSSTSFTQAMGRAPRSYIEVKEVSYVTIAIVAQVNQQIK